MELDKTTEVILLCRHTYIARRIVSNSEHLTCFTRRAAPRRVHKHRRLFNIRVNIRQFAKRVLKLYSLIGLILCYLFNVLSVRITKKKE